MIGKHPSLALEPKIQQEVYWLHASSHKNKENNIAIATVVHLV
jgi:hypothetical protein